MSELALEGTFLRTCDVCNESYNNLMSFTEHIETHGNIIEKTTTKQRRRKKKRGIKYCNICCKNFSTAGSCLAHMKHYHDATATSNFNTLFKKSLPTSSVSKEIEKANKESSKDVGIEDIFIEFENKLPFELRYDKCRCHLCDKVFDDMNDFMNHEKIHYQLEAADEIDMAMSKSVPIEKQMEVEVTIPIPISATLALPVSVPSPKSLPLPVTIPLPVPRPRVSREVNTPVQRPVTMPMPMAIPIPVLPKEEIPYSMGTSNTDNNTIAGLMCEQCQCIFTSDMDFEEHSTNCKYVEQKTRIDYEANIKTEQNECSVSHNPDSMVVENPLPVGANNTDHIRACQELHAVKYVFHCEICEKNCENPDHYEIIQWWAPPDEFYPFVCHVCQAAFTEQDALKSHGTEHCNANVC